MTVREYFEANAEGDELRLITLSGDEPTQFLGLVRKPSGRIDLVDIWRDDTGSDFADSTVEELRQHSREWMQAIVGSCPAEERDEVEAEILPQIEAI